MEFDHNNVRRRVEEDRLSSLPDELIHKILSSFDTKFAVQTCLLSPRWKLLWTSIPCLDFSSHQFANLPKFAKFVTNVLSRRNNQIEVSTLKLDFDGAASQVFVRKLASYAFSHNVQEITVTSWPKRNYQFPPCLFTSQSLKHFKFSNRRFCDSPCLTPKTPWDFPALTTLYLSQITLCDNHTEKSVDLFSKCVNLKNLTLDFFTVVDVEVFDIITPQLSTLVLIECRRKISVNLIAPQLENLTLISCSIENLNVPPGVSYLFYRDSGFPPWKLSKNGFHNLNKATICMSMHCSYKAYEEEDAIKTINMLQELHSVRDLTLGIDIIECLSSFPDLVSHHPSPFSNLISLTVDPRWRNDAYKVKISTEAKNFLLENSPNATFIMELPEPPPTKAMKAKEARAKKKAQQAAQIENHIKELQMLIEHGSMIFEQKEKGKAAFDNIMAIYSVEFDIKALLEKLLKREKAEVEARLSGLLEESEAHQRGLVKEIVNSEEDALVFKKLMSDFKTRVSSHPLASGTKLHPASQMPSSSSTSIPTPSTSSINPIPCTNHEDVDTHKANFS